MKKAFRDFLFSALDLLIPPRRTERAIEDLTLDDLFAIGTSDGPLPYREHAVRALVWELKYRGSGRAAALAGEYLAELLRAEVSEALGKPLLIPMPMSAARRKERGHNQTELLCEAALTNLASSFDYAPHALERIRHTSPQQTLARHKRLINVKNSMQAKDPALVRGRVCVVVDDVTTTGASFTEAKRSLFDAGAQEVRCVALAAS